MQDLSIDIETYSDIDLSSSGVFKYSSSENFEVLLFAYSVDFGEVHVVDLKSGEVIPSEVLDALKDPNVRKHAYNALFEWVCLTNAGYETPIESWHCTMHHAMYLSYPAGLAKTGEVLGLGADKKKSSSGSALIRYFSIPCKPTKTNGNRTRNLPHHDLEKWKLFIEYCRQDVVAEIEIYKKLAYFPVPEKEHKLWVMDCLMNARGIKADRVMVDGALSIYEDEEMSLFEEMQVLTGLNNPNSNVQLKAWLDARGVNLEGLTKEYVSDYLASADRDTLVSEVLSLRQELSKTSVKKYHAIKSCMGADDRVRGVLQVYGANRTGRWAGRLVQMQNLPRNYISTLDTARDLTVQGNRKGLSLIYGNVTDTLSQLIRTAFIPSENRRFIVADFSAIEARVIAWLANETWVMDVFATHGKIYEATASQMFHVDLALITKGNPEYELRQKGKVATLALGYQGGTSALTAMGALRMGLEEEELPDIVERWRKANPRIVDLWHKVGNAVVEVMQTGKSVYLDKGLVISREMDFLGTQDFLTITLPSGRKLYYARPHLKLNRFEREALHYYEFSNNKWCENSTYGGKLVENIVQAIARDCLAETLIRLDERFKSAPVVVHIHDEVVLDAPYGVSLEEICEVMGESISWAPGLLLKADGFECDYYKKD